MPRIVIIGAGPGGLMCARVLHRAGLPVEVYDADTAADARDPGSSSTCTPTPVRSRWASAACSRSSVPSPASRTRPSGPATSTAPSSPTSSRTPTTSSHPRSTAVSSELCWPRPSRRASCTGEPGCRPATRGGGTHVLTFAGGATVEADLVIGADGAFSRVRPLVTEAVPRYAGVSFLDVRYDAASRRHPEIAATTGTGISSPAEPTAAPSSPSATRAT